MPAYHLHPGAPITASPNPLGLDQLPRLLFNNHLAKLDQDPQVLAERLAQHHTVLDFGPCQGHEARFAHCSSTCKAGDLVLSGGYTTPIQGTMGAREGFGYINLIIKWRGKL